MAVLGPSGCGKTTLLRLIAGFIAPDEGTVSIDAMTVTDRTHVMPTRRRNVGLVPQEGALFPHLDVAANISFGLPRSERRGPRVAELLDLLELPRAIAERRPSELSGGQQQRVAVARALAPRTQRAASRRAVLLSGCCAARQHRSGGGQRHSCTQGDCSPRDPRSGRSALTGRHGRRHGPRSFAPVRSATRDLCSAGEPVRGGLHRRRLPASRSIGEWSGDLLVRACRDRADSVRPRHPDLRASGTGRSVPRDGRRSTRHSGRLPRARGGSSPGRRKFARDDHGPRCQPHTCRRSVTGSVSSFTGLSSSSSEVTP